MKKHKDQQEKIEEELEDEYHKSICHFDMFKLIDAKKKISFKFHFVDEDDSKKYDQIFSHLR